MATKAEKEKLSYVPTDALYPEEDGKPMAASDLHRHQLFRTLSTLEAHFSQDPTVYISGDILMYYVQGDPRKSIAPDVLVSFGIGMKKRRTYLVWEEGKVPDFVMEFSSKNTYHDDLTKKMDIYASLEVQDYFLYDAESLYLPSQLIGFELVDGNYVPIPPDENGGIRSSSLGLDFRIRDGEIAVFDPVTGTWVRTRAEAEAIRADTAEARAEQEANARQKETTRAETAEARAAQEAARAAQEAARAAQEAARAAQETTRADTAEAEVAQLREQLARLQARS